MRTMRATAPVRSAQSRRVNQSETCAIVKAIWTVRMKHPREEARRSARRQPVLLRRSEGGNPPDLRNMV